MTRTITLLLLSLFFSLACASPHLRQQANLSKEQTLEQINKALSLYEMGEMEAAISVVRTLIDEHPYQALHDQAYELLVEWLLQLKRHNEAKRTASYFLSNHPTSASADKIIKLFDDFDKEKIGKDKDYQEKEDIKEIPEDEGTLELDAEDSISSITPDKHDLATASYHFHVGNLALSRNVIAEALKHASAKDEALLLALKKKIDAIEAVDGKSLGIVLPLSGPFALFGQKALSAISIALDKPIAIGDSPVTLINHGDKRIFIADSSGEPAKAREMVNRLVEEHHVALIIGELLVEPSLSAALLCQIFGVPMLNLSRHPLVTDMGDNIFSFNASLEQQIENLLDYAVKKNGLKKFAIIFPRHNYGMSMSQMFFDKALQRGASITALEAYDAHETTFSEPVKKLLGKFYGEANREGIDFDAIFIPEFRKISYLIPALIQEDVLVTNDARAIKAFSLATKNDAPHYVQLLGPSSWNDQDVIEKVGKHIDGAYFVDSVSFESGDLANFFAKFLKNSGYPPSALEVFTHDAVKLAVTVLDKFDQNKNFSRKLLRDNIAHFNGKVGLLDQIAFSSNGELKAPVIGFAFTKGQAVAVTPAH